MRTIERNETRHGWTAGYLSVTGQPSARNRAKHAQPAGQTDDREHTDTLFPSVPAIRHDARCGVCGVCGVSGPEPRSECARFSIDERDRAARDARRSPPTLRRCTMGSVQSSRVQRRPVTQWRRDLDSSKGVRAGGGQAEGAECRSSAPVRDLLGRARDPILAATEHWALGYAPHVLHSTLCTARRDLPRRQLASSPPRSLPFAANPGCQVFPE